MAQPIQEDNINMNITKIASDYVIGTYLAQDRDHRRALVNAVMNLLVP
jgi:hypothetical protein